MSNYMYRGGSLSGFNDSEFVTGEIKGREFTIYKGEIRDPPAEVPKGTPVDQLPWWSPEGFEDEPYFTETAGVTGGVTYNIGTAINFGSGLPMVLFLNESNFSCSRVSYGYDFADSVPGAAAWVLGDFTEGEVRTPEHGLLGIVESGESGPQIGDWGKRAITTGLQGFVEERECLVHSSSINVDRSLDHVVSYVTPSAIPRYVRGTSVNDSPRDVVPELWGSIVADAVRDIADEFWVAALNTTLLEQVREIAPRAIDFAYDGERVYDSGEVPEFILGR
jgi:hypothetical protein